MGKFIITQGKDEKFHFSLKAANGEIILSSEMYNTRANCEKGIHSVKSNAPDDGKYERLQAANGKLYFNLKATNGQVIGVSQMYASEATREEGIASVKKNAPDAATEDQTAHSGAAH